MKDQAGLDALMEVRAALGQALEAGLRPEDAPLVRRALVAAERGAAALGDPGRSARGPQGSEAESLARRVGELTRAVAQQDEFLSTLGHELRNPLTPIFMQAQYMLDSIRQGEARALTSQWLIPQLEGFCRRLQKFLQMLERIMDVSRMSAGKLHLELEEMDMVELVRDVCSSFERELAAARSDARLSLPPRSRGVWDRLRVEQIVTNLLSNAIRYGAGKPIEITLGGDSEQIELAVKDCGVGIPEADQTRIFERFERVGQTRRSGGFGIGLWTVRQSCLAMGGHVTVKSRPGHGSEFVVVLPRVTEKASLA